MLDSLARFLRRSRRFPTPDVRGSINEPSAVRNTSPVMITKGESGEACSVVSPTAWVGNSMSTSAEGRDGERQSFSADDTGATPEPPRSAHVRLQQQKMAALFHRVDSRRRAHRSFVRAVKTITAAFRQLDSRVPRE
jgi:hypothetical protein